MKITKIILRGLLLALALYCGLLLIAGGIISGAFFNPRISPRQMERIFIEDYDLLRVVVNYLVNSEHTSIHFSPTVDKGYMSVHSRSLGVRHISISDENVSDAIEELRTRGYRIISRDIDMIRFLRWSMVGRGRGILYLFDGSAPDTTIFTFFTMLEPLSKDGWFFYEEN